MIQEDGLNRREFIAGAGAAGMAPAVGRGAAVRSGPLTRETYRGVYAYPPTPFTDDFALDEEALRSNLRKLIRIGVDGIVLAGSTGEFYTLGDKDYRRIAEILYEETRSTSVAGVLGTAALNTREAIARASMAMEIGLPAVLAMQPFYTTLARTELIAFWRELCAACPHIGFIIYHFEWVRQDYTPDIFRELAALPNLLGSKEAHYNFKEWALLQTASPLVHISATDAGWMVEMCRRKAPGVGSVNISLMPHVIYRVLQLCAEGNFQEADREFDPFTDFLGHVRSGTGRPYLFPPELAGLGDYSGAARGKALVDAFGFLKAGPPRQPGIAVPRDLQARLYDYLRQRYPNLVPPKDFEQTVPEGHKLWPQRA